MKAPVLPCLLLALVAAVGGCRRNTRYTGFELHGVTVQEAQLRLLVAYYEEVDRGAIGSDSGALKTRAQAVLLVSYATPEGQSKALSPTVTRLMAARKSRRGTFLKYDTVCPSAVRALGGLRGMRTLNMSRTTQEQERAAFAQKSGEAVDDVCAVDPTKPDVGVVWKADKLMVMDLGLKTTYDANDRIEHESDSLSTVDFAAGRVITYRKNGTDFPVRVTEWLYRENKVNVYNIDTAALVSGLNAAVAKAQWQTE